MVLKLQVIGWAARKEKSSLSEISKRKADWIVLRHKFKEC